MITNTRALQLPLGNSPRGNCNAHQLHSIALATWELPKRLMQCSPEGHARGAWGEEDITFPNGNGCFLLGNIHYHWEM